MIFLQERVLPSNEEDFHVENETLRAIRGQHCGGPAPKWLTYPCDVKGALVVGCDIPPVRAARRKR
jgi:hypothetical protein